MPFTLAMPKLSPTMEAGEIVKWHKKEGDAVAADELLFEVSTDKATVEYNSLDAGFLRKILVSEGKEAKVNEPIAVFTETLEESIEGYVSEKVKEAPQITTKPIEAVQPTRAAPSTDRLAASPLAKKIAQQKGIDLVHIQGSGPGGRIVARDLESTPQKVESGSYVEEPLSAIRKVIARRLQQAKQEIPHIYVMIEVDAEHLFSLRDQLLTEDFKVSFNDLVLKACAEALKKHPNINIGFNAKNNSIMHYKTIDIAVAVVTDFGLLTPIIRNADHKTLKDIAQEIRQLVKKSKDGKLQPQEFQGGSFTVSNLGMYMVDEFIPIVNPPQAAILGVASIRDKAIVKNGLIVPGKMMKLIMSVDHRVIDGVPAAEFLQTLKKILENPSTLLLTESAP